jgi:uncharacterized protein GlcG (DUF336 family)
VAELVLNVASVGGDAAQALIAAAVGESVRAERPMAIAVVDAAGQLKAFHRMDGAPLLAVQVAMDKAYTAAANGVATSAWYPMIKDDGALLHGMVQTPRLMIVGGGVPLLAGGVLVGAIGLSGGHYTEDEAVAVAAIKAVGFDVPPAG